MGLSPLPVGGRCVNRIGIDYSFDELVIFVNYIGVGGEWWEESGAYLQGNAGMAWLFWYYGPRKTRACRTPYELAPSVGDWGCWFPNGPNSPFAGKNGTMYVEPCGEGGGI